jgi:hypothetical protein
MTRWPVAERDGDAPPTPEELGAPAAPAGERRRVQVGPLAFALSSSDPAVVRAVAAWPMAPPAAAADVEIRIVRTGRPPFLAVQPGERARVTTWLAGDAFGAATHRAALLLAPSGSGVALACSQDDDELVQSIQNVIRIAAAWRLSATRRGLLVHASAVENDGEALVFLGPSGSGKSTVARLSRPRPILADDVIILAPREGGGACAWPSPLWAEPGFEGRCREASPRRVAALLRLRQAARHSVEALTPAAAAAVVAAHAPFVQDFPALEPSALAGLLTRGVRAATLAFAMDAGFWSLLAPERARALTRATGNPT